MPQLLGQAHERGRGDGCSATCKVEAQPLVQVIKPLVGFAAEQVVWALNAWQVLAMHPQDSVCPEQALSTHVAVAGTVDPVVTLTSTQISSALQGAPEGPQALAEQLLGHILPESALMHWPHSGGPQQASPDAQTLPPHGWVPPPSPDGPSAREASDGGSPASGQTVITRFQ